MNLPGNSEITHIAIDPNDGNNILVTYGNYGHSDYVYLSRNALSANPTFTNVTGDLPPMPVYCAIFDVNKPEYVLLGTEFGVWGTKDVFSVGGNVEWTDENVYSKSQLYVPVYDIEQQRMGQEEAGNFYRYYIGTHGRGLWETQTLVALGDDSDDIANDDKWNADFSVFPNPMTAEGGQMAIRMKEATTADVTIYDLNGRPVKNFRGQQFTAGENNMRIETQDLPTGTYMLIVDTPQGREVSKFVVLK